jgi:sulfite exporter TauE/SafE
VQQNMQGLILGLANGTTCLAYCAPVLIPFFLGEGKRTRQNLSLLGQFLGGRLAGYLLFAVLAWVVSRWIVANTFYRGIIFGLTYILLSIFLGVYGLIKVPTPCVGSVKGIKSALGHWQSFLPVTLGFLTGLNLCPPFLLAFANAAATRSLLSSLVFFGAFFLGTSLYLIPLSLLGGISRFHSLQTVGKLASVIMAVYYFYVGIITFAGGMIRS